MQYFNYPHSAAAPTGFQVTQKATASLLPQPDETVVTWTVPVGIYSAKLLSDPHSEFLDLAADASFSGEQLIASFAFDYLAEDGVTYHGECVDDTSTTTLVATPTQNPQYMTAKLSGHQPGTLTKLAYNPEHWSNHTNNDFFCGKDFYYQLKDAFGAPFPDVWVQERFDEDADHRPPNFFVNGDNGQWTTRRLAYGASLPIGSFIEPDWIRMNWGSLEFAPPAVTLTHHYWAATWSITQGGIDMGAHTMVLTPGLRGVAGTAVHNP